MTAAAPRPFFSSRFFISLISLALVLIALGGSVFRYLTVSAQVVLAQTRPVAITTTFVPAASPFSFSLLTAPEALLAVSQATVPDESQAIVEAQQLKQNLLDAVGLDYDRDLLPWLGDEATFALTDTDLDADMANGEQPGYLIAAAIAPQKQRDAQAFLRLLWQRRSLSGAALQSEQISGVRVLYAVGSNALTAASALVGDRFVLFANDVRVLRRSIRAAESATNLAQNRAYRETAARLPEDRIGLAYFENGLVNRDRAGRSHTAMSVELAPGGVVAQFRQPERRADRESATKDWTIRDSSAKDSSEGATDALRYLPQSSAWAIASANFSQLRPFLDISGMAQKNLPEFLSWAALSTDSNYALGRVSDGWVLAIKRSEADVAKFDELAYQQGYSAVPVALGAQQGEAALGDVPEESALERDMSGRDMSERDVPEKDVLEAIAWTRFKAKQNYRASNSSLETDVLGLHLTQGDYEIFTNSLAAMEQSIAAAGSSLRSSASFEQAAAALPMNGSYFYANHAAAFGLLERKLPQVSRVLQSFEPLPSYVRSVSATKTSEAQGESVSVFIRMNR